MNQSQPLTYNNDVTPEYLRTLDKEPLTEEQIVGFAESAILALRKSEAYVAAHPPIAIYRVATQGSQTRDGGVISRASSAVTCTREGVTLRMAQIGDVVSYPDGSTATIITGAGKTRMNVAVVGSQLSNGDQIINTLDHGWLFIEREGVPLPADFLPNV
ncbi:PAAR domain-containing protein [Pseudomonas sp. NFR16]|uniref:PAAR domain-containing protein n=1 Tax=Pseudomonas sp. NFR16 TaxID=1566248 RepID=UPI0008AEAC1C|nr:PAAR domain-containing protein [Pseudomonas sp. NFR16]SEJ82884.1 hypothetical protein SAMN03159495_4791 [Pseudomonas sp. NFR16]